MWHIAKRLIGNRRTPTRYGLFHSAKCVPKKQLKCIIEFMHTFRKEGTTCDLYVQDATRITTGDKKNMWTNCKNNRRGWNFRGEYKVILSGEKCPAWKGDNVKNVDAGRARARKIFDLCPCIICGIPVTDRHHKDNNSLNNTVKNIMILCHRCHMHEHAIMRQLGLTPKYNRISKPKAPSPCSTCGIPYKPLCNGRCHNCSMYFYKHGVERSLLLGLTARIESGWEIRDCGCSAGLQWGGECPIECRVCRGGGIVYHHIKSGAIALYPGGPFAGVRWW